MKLVIDINDRTYEMIKDRLFFAGGVRGSTMKYNALTAIYNGKPLEQEPCEDAVSRQVVKEKMIYYGFLAPDMTVTEFVADLPSVNPQNPKTDRIEYGTDGNAYRLTISNGKEFEQESFINKPCVSSGVCEHDKNKVLDRIRAEIIEEKGCAYADFDKYKVDYLGIDAEYTEDELPDDDFRYGMERAIEIIDKYKAESEDNG